MKPPLTRQQWISEFADELAKLRELSWSSRFAHAVAQIEWVSHKAMNPRKAAREWVRRQKP